MTEAAAQRQDSASARSPAERLRAYLAALPESARKLLSTEIERARQRGEAIPGGDMIIAALRPAPPPVAPKPPETVPPQAIRDEVAARFVFRPVEPFLIDERLETKVRGRIARHSLTAIWTWIARDLQPDEAEALEAACTAAIAAGDEAGAAQLAADFAIPLCAAIRAELEEVSIDEAQRKRLVARLGDERALDDLTDVLVVLGNAPAIAAAIAKAPTTIRNLADDGLANARAMLDPMANTRTDLLAFALVLFQGRLVQKAHLARLAVSAAESDEPAKIAVNPYRYAVDLVVGEIERSAFRVSRALKEGRGDRVTAALKDLHDAVRSLRTDMSLAGDGPWQRRLAKLRADLARLLTAEIEGVPGEMRRLLRPRQRGDQPAEAISEDVVADVETRLDLLSACRSYASEIALNEITLRIFTEIQGYLDPTLTQLLENIRNAPDVDRALKISQIEAAVRFSARIFGASYAQLLQKAADVAINAGKTPGRQG
ncbi:MAG: hypothetical protein LCH88_01610 [Proteobacteria bacterium]|nr:hypothetical protein [Pseudomonadota bacterium]